MSLQRQPDAVVEIYISCRKLKSTDTFSKSDPCCILSLRDGDAWKEVGRTEVIKDNENPEFAKPLEAEYFFRQVHPVRFDVYDIDDKSGKLTSGNHLGFLETTIGEVVSNSPLTKALTLKEKQSESTITLRVEETSRHQEVLNLTFCAQKLDKMDTFSKSDPFLQFSRKEGGDRWTVVTKTEVVKDNLNPNWSPLRVKVTQLCSGNVEDPVKVDCFDYESNGSHKLIGSFTTSVRELKEGNGKQWPVVNPSKAQKKSSYQNSGIVTLKSCESDGDKNLDFSENVDQPVIVFQVVQG